MSKNCGEQIWRRNSSPKSPKWQIIVACHLTQPTKIHQARFYDQPALLMPIFCDPIHDSLHWLLCRETTQHLLTQLQHNSDIKSWFWFWFCSEPTPNPSSFFGNDSSPLLFTASVWNRKIDKFDNCLQLYTERHDTIDKIIQWAVFDLGNVWHSWQCILSSLNGPTRQFLRT